MFQIKKNIASCSTHSVKRDCLAPNHLAEVMTCICKKCQSQQFNELMYGKNPKSILIYQWIYSKKLTVRPWKFRTSHPKRTWVFQTVTKSNSLDDSSSSERCSSLSFAKGLCTSHVVVLDFSHHQGHHHHRPQPSLYFSWDSQTHWEQVEFARGRRDLLLDRKPLPPEYHLGVSVVCVWCIRWCIKGVSHGNPGKL